MGYKILQHAKWYLEFGPGATDTEPDADDRAAIKIIAGLMQELALIEGLGGWHEAQ